MPAVAALCRGYLALNLTAVSGTAWLLIGSAAATARSTGVPTDNLAVDRRGAAMAERTEARSRLLCRRRPGARSAMGEGGGSSRRADAAGGFLRRLRSSVPMGGFLVSAAKPAVRTFVPPWVSRVG